eukprot:INCI19078.1.p1 GENE.INCI19078.1~~INCI19078.1.p1  ORF type:complete len:390 (+),score=67.00 INCI19078.1:390-1559(+)
MFLFGRSALAVALLLLLPALCVLAAQGQQQKQQQQQQQQNRQQQKQRHSNDNGEGHSQWPPWVRLTNHNCTHPKQPVVILHVPKSGGTTVCDVLKEAQQCIAESVPWGNCWVFTDGPEWCCDYRPPFIAAGGAREKSCDERRTFPKAFTMIERYMDTDNTTGRTSFCEGITYGIILRDAVARAASHAHDFLTRGPGGPLAWRIALAELVRDAPAKVVQTFFDDLDSLPPLSARSQKLLNETFGFWSEALERAAYKVNAFTSNYIVRMLLGRQLGDVPLLASSKTLTEEKMSAAWWTIDQFDFVLHLESLLDPATAAAQKFLLGAAVNTKDLVAERDGVYERLLSPEFRAWLEKRNALDAAIVNSVPNRARSFSGILPSGLSDDPQVAST